MVASLYEAALLGLVATLFLPYLLLRNRKRGIALLSSFTLLGLLSVLYAWDTYDLPSLVAGLCGAGTGRGGEAVAMALGTKPTGELARLLATTSDRRVARAAGRAPRGGRSPAEANGAAANTGVLSPCSCGPR